MFRQLTSKPFQLAARRNASSFARLSVMGRVGGEPEAQETDAGKVFVKYSIATNPTKDGPPSWFNISVFEPKQVEFCGNYLKKGALVLVEANVINKSYEKPDGTTAYATNYYQQRIDIIKNPYNPDAAGAATTSE
ncbi:Rim1 protein [Saccharomycopsis crataegensis]|uniref:Single-stranded DNA-binding protein n=1 Tax=Saccharomycopsis crataegensis TaxID=43959 RepID=A0AAV5QH81_9ASCO|nr:Rim1 protein [Saccharomycopsis crataegensis]